MGGFAREEGEIMLNEILIGFSILAVFACGTFFGIALISVLYAAREKNGREE